MSIESLVKQFERRLVLVFWMRTAVWYCALWSFGLGVGVIAARTFVGTDAKRLAWGMLGFLGFVLAAWFDSRRQIPGRRELLAILDKENQAGGLVMAGESEPVGAWNGKASRLTLPVVAWDGRKSWTSLAVAAIFLTAAFLVPIPAETVRANQKLEIGKEVEKLEQKIETLKEEDLLDQKKTASLVEALQKVQQQAEGKDPQKSWEALDRIQETVTNNAKQAAENSVAKTEEMAKAQTLAEGLAAENNQLDEQTMNEATQELAKLAQQIMGQSGKGAEALNKELSEALKEALKSGKLSKEQLAELAKALKGSKQDILKQMDKLQKAGLIDPKTLKQCEKAGQCNGAGLAAFIKENKGSGSVGELMDAYGTGGTSRGRGDAKLNYGDASSEEGAKFKEKTLSSGAGSDLKNSQTIAVTNSAPQIEKGNTARPGALSGTQAGNGSAFQQTILPKHRGAVKRYFERQ
ncbi:MAG: hypothetical protein K1Y36_09410 [Blastocatellia bacterium]|nr:hypothetical protein [Blastocatellia bacterium]